MWSFRCGLERHQRVIREVWFDPARKRRPKRRAVRKDPSCSASCSAARRVAARLERTPFSYAAVQLPLLARLIRERAPLGKLLLSPMLAVP